MILLNNILYLSSHDINHAGISIRTAEKWTFKIKDPSDKRCDLFPYDQIKPKYQQQITKHYGDVYIYHAHELIKRYLKSDKTARDFFRTYTLEDGQGLPSGHIDKYTKAAEWLNMLVEMLSVTVGFKKRYNMSRGEFWTSACAIIAAEGIDLPGSYKRLSEKVRNYQQNGYIEVISERFDKKNRQIITDEVGEWLIARYSSQVNKCRVEDLWIEYNLKAEKNGWKKLETDRTIFNYLHRPDVEYRWYAGRYGELSFKKKFGLKQKRDLPIWRDALWFSDGTKVNYYYRTKDGKAAKLIVYEVMDVFSECFLGCAFAFEEDHVIQYEAYKNAIMFAGAKPYEIRYDNQGGHKKLASGDFLKKVAKISHTTQPYNGNSKTLESAFGRFQQGYLRKEWYFSGQNVTAKSEESKANMEFILANTINLLSIEDVKEQYLKRRAEWNAAKHPKMNVSRLEAYLQSENPEHYAVDYLDMVEIFWITSDDSLTYYAEGIMPTIKDTTYHFEVLDANGMPDMSFRKRYIGQKFIYKYDPTNMSSLRLYIEGSEGLKFVAIALPKVSHQTAVQCQTDGEMSEIHKLIELAKKERADNWNDLQTLQAKYGELPEQNGLRSPKVRGINQPKKNENSVEISENRTKVAEKRDKVPVFDMGSFQKQQSMIDYDPLDHYLK